MDQDSASHPLGLMTERRDELAAGWAEVVSRTLASHISRAELDRELHELYGAIASAWTPPPAAAPPSR